MLLDEWPQGRVGRTSAIDRLPDDVRDQLVDARLAGTHSVRAMVAWLTNEGYTDVTVNALANWFSTRGYPSGAGRVEPQ